jgi:hypothetical protein
MKKTSQMIAMEKEAEEARKLLELAANPEPPAKTPEEESEEKRLAEEETARIAALPPADSTPTEVEALKAEIAGLKRMVAEGNDQSWQQKWASADGLLKTQGAEIKTLREELAALKAKPEPVIPEPDDAYEIDVAEIGEKAAKLRKADRDRMKALETEIADMKEKVTGSTGELEKVKGETETLKTVAAQTAAEKYHQTVIAAVPDWTPMMGTAGKKFADQNPKVTEFLHHSYRGRSNCDDLNDAYRKGDIETVKQICDEARKFAGLELKPSDPPLDPKPKPSEKAEEYLEPGKTSSGTKDPTNKKETILESEWNAFNDSIARKTFRGTLTERLALSEKYKTAALEGRIAWGR